MKLFLRWVTLASTTFWGILLLFDLANLVSHYNSEYRRFAPFPHGVTSHAIWCGLGFGISGLLYAYLMWSMRAESSSPVPRSSINE